MDGANRAKVIPTSYDMRIALITYEFPPRILGGLGIHCAHLVKALTRKGVEVIVLTPAVEGASSQEFKDRLKIYRLCASRKRYPQSYNNYPIFYYQNRVKEFNRRVVEEFKEIEKETGAIDLYHCQDWGAAKSGISLKKRHPKPLVLTFHGIEPLKYPDKSEQRKWVISVEKKGAKAADKIITVSNFAKSMISNIYEIPERKCHVVYNGIDLKRFDPQRIAGEQKDKITHLYRLEGRKIIAYVGRLDSNKGIPTLIRAAKIWKEMGYVATKTVVAGTGRKHLMENFIKIRDSLDLNEDVIFTDYIDDLTRDTLYTIADVVAIPSTYEGFGFTAVESMAMEAPLVLSKIPTFEEIVSNRKTGLFFEPRNPKDLAEKITFLLTHEEFAHKMGKRARRSIRKLFTWEKTAEKTIEIYEQALKENI